ncbi:MAG: flagellar motor switch phosphatase FliY [Lachnospiraceae bacterium]|nr:flagellar motor switch phosphatase FliY [Lachnospiraceae bacterium]
MEILNSEQVDILGEIANISMGNSATSLSMMLNKRVEITTPSVKVIKRSQALDDYENKCAFIQIHFIKGIEGNNVLILKENDIKIMTDLMMGGDGSNIAGEIGELQLSAAAEAMNQMMGSAATSLSTLIGVATDISTPQVDMIDVESIKIFERMFEGVNDNFIKVAFRINVEHLIDSVMVQLYPLEFALNMIRKFEKARS